MSYINTTTDIDIILERKLKEYDNMVLQKNNNFIIYHLEKEYKFNSIIPKSKFIYDNNNSNENIIYKYNNLCIKFILTPNLELFPTELQILNLLSDLVINQNTPHLHIPLLYGKTTNLDYLYKKYKQQQAYYMITNWCDGSDLLKYIKYNYISSLEWKIILFKILYTLTIIFDKYPDFRHNDLSLKNILVSKINKKPHLNHFNLYQLNNIYYKIPITDYEIYLWDFEFSNIYDITQNVEIDKDMEKEYGIRYTRNQYYDLHFFLNSTYHLCQQSIMPISVRNFIKNKIPEVHLVKNNDSVKNQRLIIDKEFLTPIQLLQENFFNEFIYEFDQSSNNCTCLSTNHTQKKQNTIIHKYNI